MSENDRKPSLLVWVTLVLCVFILRSHAWLVSELWYDEVLTLQRFILPHLDSPGAIFSDYPIANNHILATWLGCQWMNLTGGIFSEWLLRLPSLCFGMAAIILVMVHWRRFLGSAVAGLGGLLLAVSPVFTAYAYQLRGYSLTLFLATLAISGVLEATGGRKLRGQILLAISGVLLPLVIPTNLIFAPVLAVLLVTRSSLAGQRLKRSCLVALPWCLSSLAGGCYYLTIWAQFRRALSEPDGWNSCWLLAAQLLLGVAMHGIVLWCVWLWNWRQAKPARAFWWPFGSMAVVFLAAMFASRSGHVPFPRVFLVLLPAATWLLLEQISSLKLSVQAITRCAAAILVVGIIVERIGEGVTDYQLKHGVFPDNLLQQYYRGAADLREIAENDKLGATKAVVIFNPYDAMAGAFYLRLMAKPEDGGMAFGANEMRDDRKALVKSLAARKFAVAATAEMARDAFRQAGYESPAVQQIYRTASGRRGVFELKP